MNLKIDLSAQKRTYIKATQNPDDFPTTIQLYEESFVEVLPHISSCSRIAKRMKSSGGYITFLSSG